MDDRVSKQPNSGQSASNLTPKYFRMNSTKSEISEKETHSNTVDSGFMSNSNLDSDFISTCSLLSEDNLSPTSDLPHDSGKPQLAQQHSHFDSGVDVDISEHFSDLNIKPCTNIPTIVPSHHKVSSIEINDDGEYWKICYSQDEDGDT